MGNWGRSEPRIKCMAIGCKSAPLTDAEVARNASDAAFAWYFEKKQKWRDAKTWSSCLKRVAEAESKFGKMSAMDQLLLEDTLRDALPYALMCPKCSYGPIELHACSDLLQHHMDKVDGAQIDNRCPNKACRFFSPDASEWKEWDGILRAPHDLETGQGLPVGMPEDHQAPKPVEFAEDERAFKRPRI